MKSLLTYEHIYKTVTNIKAKKFSINSQSSFVPFCNPFLLLSVQRKLLIYFLLLYISLHFLEFCINVIIQQVFFPLICFFFRAVSVYSKIGKKIQCFCPLIHNILTMDTSHLSSLFVIISEPVLIFHYHPKQQLTFRVYSGVHLMDLEKIVNIITCIHYHRIIQNGFTALKSFALCLLIPPHNSWSFFF